MPTDKDIDAIYQSLFRNGWPKRLAWQTAVDMLTKGPEVDSTATEPDAGVVPARSTSKKAKSV